ncbi:MAG: thermonuclease family protein [Candidatus Puniceispirillales bacterium WSBS_2018_MAG_OTU23]
MVEFICTMFFSFGVLPDSLMPQSCGMTTEAIVQQIIDGDTIVVKNEHASTKVRLLGIDTPEIFGKCPEERSLAQAAKAHASASLPIGQRITLTSAAGGWSRDKYGRLLAKVSINGTDLGQALVSSGLAQRWSSSGPRPVWCGE